MHNRREKILDQVTDVLRGTFDAICREQRPYMALTSGRDSRMMLSCLRTSLGRLDFFTARLPDTVASDDCEVAAWIARRAGLSHQVLEYLEPTPQDLELWLYRTGCCVGEPRGWRGIRTWNQLASDRHTWRASRLTPVLLLE